MPKPRKVSSTRYSLAVLLKTNSRVVDEDDLRVLGEAGL